MSNLAGKNNSLLILVVVMATVVIATAEMQQDFPLFSRQPAPAVGKKSRGGCLDFQLYKTFAVGEEWSSPNSNCLLSKCVQDNGKIYIDKYQCRSVPDSVDYAKLEGLNAVCREATGDRRQPFPDCCSRLICQQLDTKTNRFFPLPDHLYPYLQ